MTDPLEDALKKWMSIGDASKRGSADPSHAPPPEKPVDLFLAYYFNEWKVIHCHGSLWPRPGMMMTLDELIDLEKKHPHWTIDVVDNDILPMLLGIFKSVIQIPKLTLPIP